MTSAVRTKNTEPVCPDPRSAHSMKIGPVCTGSKSVPSKKGPVKGPVFTHNASPPIIEIAGSWLDMKTGVPPQKEGYTLYKTTINSTTVVLVLAFPSDPDALSVAMHDFAKNHGHLLNGQQYILSFNALNNRNGLTEASFGIISWFMKQFQSCCSFWAVNSRLTNLKTVMEFLYEHMCPIAIRKGTMYAHLSGANFWLDSVEKALILLAEKKLLFTLLRIDNIAVRGSQQEFRDRIDKLHLLVDTLGFNSVHHAVALYKPNPQTVFLDNKSANAYRAVCLKKQPVLPLNAGIVPKVTLINCSVKSVTKLSQRERKAQAKLLNISTAICLGDNAETGLQTCKSASNISDISTSFGTDNDDAAISASELVP